MTVSFSFERAPLWAGLAVALTLGLPSQPPLTAETLEVNVALPATLQAGSDDAFEVPEALVQALLDVRDEDRLRVSEFPLAPGERGSVELRPVVVYDAKSQILLAGKDGELTELPKSQRKFFHGSADDGTRLAFSMDRESGRIRGASFSPSGIHQLVSHHEGDSGLHAIRSSSEGKPELQRSCGSDQLDSRDLDNPLAGMPQTEVVDFPASTPQKRLQQFGELDLGSAFPFDATQTQASQRIVTGPLKAIIAVDTDNEFHHLLHGNNLTDAVDWIAELFNEMNVIYNRDVNVHLVQGPTIFRLDTDASPTYDDDPWTGGAGASGGQLNELSSYWLANYGGLDRSMTMLLSAKGGFSGLSASGLAWVDGYCETQVTGGGYSINQVFYHPVTDIQDNVSIVAHELGHNFGSSHTHCYVPALDECFNGEGGCFSGSTQCPTGGSGTLMSYCHLNCSANQLAFHPTVISNINAHTAAHSPSCLSNLNDDVFEDDFEANSFGVRWDS